MDQLNNSNVDIAPDLVPVQTWNSLIQSSPGLTSSAAALSPVATALHSTNFKSGSAGWLLDSNGDIEANNGTFRGHLEANSVDIPDTTTSNSFHVASSGNSWWGANKSAGYTSANAYILSDGSAVFKNVTIGGTTVQYVISNSGIFSYGDGSDGDVTISANTTLSADMYYRNLTINSGAVINTAGYRIFCSQSLTLSGSSNIHRNGNNGGSGGYNNGGNGLAAAYLGGSGNGRGDNHPTGYNTTSSISGASGGSGGGGTSGGGAAGTATGPSIKLIANWHLAVLLDIATGDTPTLTKFTGGAGGGAGGTGVTFSGGGAGSGGGIVAIYAKSITIGSGSTITATGGTGSAGTGGDKEGGGGGGGGGAIVLVYNSLSNSGSITASGGTGGAGGGGGSAGNTGSSGVIYQFQLSL